MLQYIFDEYHIKRIVSGLKNCTLKRRDPIEPFAPEEASISLTFGKVHRKNNVLVRSFREQFRLTFVP